MANARRWSIDAAEDDDASARRRAGGGGVVLGRGKGPGAAAVRGLAALDGAVVYTETLNPRWCSSAGAVVSLGIP